MKQTQHQAILSALEDGQRLTGLDALKLCGTMKLSTRIGELKKKRHKIKDKYIKVKDRHIKIYWLGRGTL